MSPLQLLTLSFCSPRKTSSFVIIFALTESTHSTEDNALHVIFSSTCSLATAAGTSITALLASHHHSQVIAWLLLICGKVRLTLTYHLLFLFHADIHTPPVLTLLITEHIYSCWLPHILSKTTPFLIPGHLCFQVIAHVRGLLLC